MVSHERLIASLGHDPFPIVTIQRQEVPVPNPILGKTMPESREGTPGEPTNSYGCPVLLQQMNRGGPIAKGIEGPREIFGNNAGTSLLATACRTNWRTRSWLNCN
jgi:hypothetical protein